MLNSGDSERCISAMGQNLKKQNIPLFFLENDRKKFHCFSKKSKKQSAVFGKTGEFFCHPRLQDSRSVLVLLWFYSFLPSIMYYIIEVAVFISKPLV